MKGLSLILVLIIDGDVMDSMAVKIQILVKREYPSMGSVKMLLGTDALQVLPMIKLSLMMLTIMYGDVMDNMVVTILVLVTRENLSMGNVIMFVEMHVAQVEPMLELLLIQVFIIDGGVMDSMEVATQALV